MNYHEFFRILSGGQNPYPYQARLVAEPWPETLEIPTGLGKTMAVVGAWLYRRLSNDPTTPRRLVYCLPMRVLVEQVQRTINTWLAAAEPLFRQQGLESPTVHLLMGGETQDGWAAQPESVAILVGTQDMLLSRALMRGYGMNRSLWPVHFALLHNDAFWVFDEVQLMGTGLTTSVQLEAFRRTFALGATSRSLWVSATMHQEQFATVDFRPYATSMVTLGLAADDRQHPRVNKLLNAAKRLIQATSSLTPDTGRQNAKVYLDALAAEVAKAHRPGSTTLVILNRVDRAQGLFDRLAKLCSSVERLLIHGRFRPAERKAVEAKLRQAPLPTGRILVATQAVEAGVDMTSATLFTELAPCSSMVQRFGRCNRYGEEECGQIFWLDITENEDLAQPYDLATLDTARQLLMGLTDVDTGSLPSLPPEERVGGSVLRRQDLLDLFNTDPDLSGFDVDVAPFIRDQDQPGVMVFWRGFDKEPDNNEPAPQRQELCPVSLGQIKQFLKKTERLAWNWDFLAGDWQKTDSRQLMPGMVLLLRAADGGYDQQQGFLARVTAAVPLVPMIDLTANGGYDSDNRSVENDFVLLSRHLDQTVAAMTSLNESLALSPTERKALLLACRWHDGGKGHAVMQNTLTRCLPDGDERKNVIWGKSSCHGKHQRPHFRHEVASALLWLAQGPQSELQDLVAYLILAHHGKVRLSLRALPLEKEPPQAGQRFARGIWQGDILPAMALGDGVTTQEAVLSLAIMEMGEGSDGPSWTARSQGLLRQQGPFRLAWLEALVRVADWRGSAHESTGEQS